MARVVVTSTARGEIRSLIASRSLPESTNARLRELLETLRDFPLLGAEIGGRWKGLRFIVGPWRWMIVIYQYDASLDRVEVLSIQDGRSAQSPLSGR